MKITIPLKMPSLNEYINECKRNRFAGAKMKKRYQQDIGWFLKQMPRYEEPVKLHFTWVEKNHMRDLDNIHWAKKFILDAMVECGKLIDDSQKYVKGFTDDFIIGDEYKVIVTIEEVKNEN